MPRVCWRYRFSICRFSREFIMLWNRTIRTTSLAGRGFQGIPLRQVREQTAKLGRKTVSLYQR